MQWSLEQIADKGQNDVSIRINQEAITSISSGMPLMVETYLGSQEISGD